MLLSSDSTMCIYFHHMMFEKTVGSGSSLQKQLAAAAQKKGAGRPRASYVVIQCQFNIEYTNIPITLKYIILQYYKHNKYEM